MATADASFSDAEYDAVWKNKALEQPDETQLTIIEGTLPHNLHGDYFLNGPGMLQVGDAPTICSPFDGHGFIRRMRFRGSATPTYRARYVGTSAYKAEAAAGQPLFRGIASGVAPYNTIGGKLKNMMSAHKVLKSVANTCVVQWGGKVFCLWEGGPPHVVDPETLETLSSGPFTFGGALSSMKPFLAHTRHDAQRQLLVGMTILPGLGGTTFSMVDFTADMTKVAKRTETIPRSLFCHDFLITQNWYIVFENPVLMQKWETAKAMLGNAPVMTSAYAPDFNRHGKMILVPRRDPTKPRIEIDLEEHCVGFHHGNAYEDEYGHVVIHSCVFKHFEFPGAFGYDTDNTDFDIRRQRFGDGMRLWGITIDPHTETLVDRKIYEDVCGDFPDVHPERDGLRCQFMYFGSSLATEGSRSGFPMQRVVRVDLDSGEQVTWDTPEGQFVAEVLFAPAADGTLEGDGYVLAMLHNGAEKTQLLIFDAADIAAGPLCRLQMPQALPFGFHGSWQGNDGMPMSRL